MKRSLPLGLMMTLAACSSASMRGGKVVRHEEAPPGKLLAAFTVGECKDSSGSGVPGPMSIVRVIRSDDGRLMILELREHDALLVDNAIPDAGGHVFQAVLERKSGKRTLREYRIPPSGGEMGELSLARAFEVKKETERGFLATYRAAALMCTLEYIPGPQ